jgi:hypothetical protein
MGNPVDEQILRLYLDVKESPTSLFPPLTSQLPFLILSLRTFKERRHDLQSTVLRVWKQLRKQLYCIHAQTFDKPKPIDITRALYSIQSLLSLVGIQSTQTGPRISKKSKSFIPELTEIFEKFGRQFLTTILGQYLSLQDLLDYVSREGELFLGFQPRRDILDRDENGEYQEHLTIQIDEITDLLYDQIYLFQKIFLANIQTLTKFLNCLYKIKPIHSQAPELQNLLSKVNDFPVFRWPLIPHAKGKQLDRLHTAQRGLRYLLSLLPPPSTRPPPQPPPSSSGSSTLPPITTTTHTATPQPPPSTSGSSTLPPITTTTHTATPRLPLSTIGQSIGTPQAATQAQPRRSNIGMSIIDTSHRVFRK